MKLLSIILFITLFTFLFVPTVYGQPTISGISTNLGSYHDGKVPAYEKFELQFDIATQVKHTIFPYTDLEFYKMPSRSGISVDGIFTSPDGKVFSQPGFYKQEFVEEVKNGRDWFYPKDEYHWVVRFSPNETGTWSYKLKAQDASGTYESQTMQFEVTPSNNKGFINVSKRDSRYFEYDDGSYFPANGYNTAYREIDKYNPVQSSTKVFKYLSDNKITLVRNWIGLEWGLYGADGSPWVDYKSIGYYGNWYWLTSGNDAYVDSEIVSQVWKRPGESTCMLYGSYGEGADVAIKRDATYRLKVRYKVLELGQIPLVQGSPIGFAVKDGGWMYYPDNLNQNCNYPTAGKVLIANYPDPSGSNRWQNNPDPVDSSWVIGQADVSFPGKNFLPELTFTIQNADEGRVLIDNISILELDAQGNEGVDSAIKGDFDWHWYIDQKRALGLDRVTEKAWENKVYVRSVINHKGDSIFSSLDNTGRLVWPADENYFYGDGRSMTKGRFLQTAYWRYLQARWGYSPSIHSWELLNEGNPANTNHFVLTDELGKYMKCGAFGVSVPDGDGQKCTFDHPNSHPVSTSTWHSFPSDAFWANAKYPNVDIADFHAYISSAESSYYDIPENVIGWGSIMPQPGKPIIRGEVGLYNSGNTDNSENTELARDTEGVWLHNLLWAGLDHKAAIPLYWYSREHINNPTDKKHNYKNLYNFLYSIPLSNGNYKDLGATNVNADVRVVGQKDVVNGNAHMWIQNKNHTWKNVIDSVTVPPQGGTVEIGGFAPSTMYTVFEWDTYSKSDDPNTIVKRNWQVTSDATGKVTLEYQNLISDTAYVIAKNGKFPFDMPGSVPPPACALKGDANCSGKVDILDLSVMLRNFGKAFATRAEGDVSGDGFINITDLSEVIREFGKAI